MQLPFTDEELKPAVERCLEKVRPTLAKDSGGVHLIAIRDGAIYLQFTGGCVGCSSASVTLKHVIERQLHLDIHPKLKAVEVPLGQEEQWEEISVG